MPTTADPAHLAAALEALQAHGTVPSDYSLAQATAHPLFGRLVLMYALALRRGERPWPPPPQVRPSVMAPAAPSAHHTPAHHWASPAWVRHAHPFDAKAAAAGADKD